jgi:CheY-like chemotaxis protein
MPNKTMELLLIEDNPDHVELVREYIKDINVPHRFTVVIDGEKASDYLHKRNGYSQAKRPDLILLDLNLPRKDGRELLSEIKQDRDLKRIPLLILSTSDAEKDIVQAYNLHANSYIVKKGDLDTFNHLAQMIEKYWFGLVALPP